MVNFCALNSQNIKSRTVVTVIVYFCRRTVQKSDGVVECVADSRRFIGCGAWWRPLSSRSGSRRVARASAQQQQQRVQASDAACRITVDVVGWCRLQGPGDDRCMRWFVQETIASRLLSRTGNRNSVC